ncbi:acyltransferase family protein [Catenuloplanes japonicus]|uniref:acyltransferase family protein n=1 Tax=Catenuloplanes japonicus TaxID=33876 RepID=UPI000527DBC2|nr:acyltransferase [Catenuloplanes japonicus]
MRHIPSLDGLRGLAVAGVLLFHTGHLPGGFLGVDLFFVLSGYLITALLLRGPGSLTAFWARRVRRLFPALAVLLAAVTLLVTAFGAPGLLRSTLSDGPWVQANLANWHLLAESAGYWDRFGEARVFAHLWSIAVEEQFYLLWPLIVLAAGPRRTWIAAACGAVASLTLMIIMLDPSDPSRVYTGTDTRAFSLLLGALAAALPHPARLRARVAGPAIALPAPSAGPTHAPAAEPHAPWARLANASHARWAGTVATLLTAGIGASWVLADDTGTPWLFTGGLFLHALASAALIRLCAHVPGTVVARALSWRPLRWLGGISYSLYLWHWPVIVLLSPKSTGLSGWTWTAVVLAVSVSTAILSKRLVEDPIRFRANWARGRVGTVVFAGATAVLAALWLIIPGPAPIWIDVDNL